tara:strand:- start:315 stop:1310 length:996 start_codon:yes stop_codon:yes gene_type:complete
MKLLLLLFSALLYSQNEVCFTIEDNPNQNQAGLAYFTKYVNVLDCFDIYASSNISDDKVLHAAAIAAELLDNDEDGEVDDLLLKVELSNSDALMPLLMSESSQAANNFFNNYNGDGASAVLFNNEIDPSQPGHWGDDASVEEIIHTINHVGHVNIYSEDFNIEPNSSTMSDAMDIARGGQFINIPNQYPEEAWYHYDDWTCDYECMAIEYLYWSIVSHMGILNDNQTCNGIDNEWELCTPDLFASTDIMMHALITNPLFKLPQLAPDGNYCPDAYILGDINEDVSVNILDVILIINIILGIDEVNELADLNYDNDINILDVVQIVNIILSR